jgi:hypothetical protein
MLSTNNGGIPSCCLPPANTTAHNVGVLGCPSSGSSGPEAEIVPEPAEEVAETATEEVPAVEEIAKPKKKKLAWI